MEIGVELVRVVHHERFDADSQRGEHQEGRLDALRLHHGEARVALDVFELHRLFDIGAPDIGGTRLERAQHGSQRAGRHDRVEVAVFEKREPLRRRRRRARHRHRRCGCGWPCRACDEGMWRAEGVAGFVVVVVGVEERDSRWLPWWATSDLGSEFAVGN